MQTKLINLNATRHGFGEDCGGNGFNACPLSAARLTACVYNQPFPGDPVF